MPPYVPQGSAALPGRGYALVSFDGDIERVSAFDLTAVPSVTKEVRCPYVLDVQGSGIVARWFGGCIVMLLFAL